MDLGLKIRKLMEEKKISQTELGKLLGMKPQGIQSYLTNASIPPLPKIKAMCEIFNVSADFFINDEVKTKDHKMIVTDSMSSQIIEDLKRDKEFLMGIIQSKLFREAPAQGNFIMGSKKKDVPVKKLYPVLTSLKIG